MHPSAAFDVVEDVVDRADPFLKATLASLVGAAKSSVLALAMVHRVVTPSAAFDAARVEEEWQIGENGLVEEGHDTARASLRTALSTAAMMLHLSPASRPPPIPKGAAAVAVEAAARAARVGARQARERQLVATKRAEMRAERARERASA